MTSLKQRHAEAIEGKNALLKEYDGNIEGYDKMFTELLNEVRDKHVSRRQMQKLNKKAAETHANYLQHKVMYDALKDEVRDQQSTSIELRQQLEEYEETIEYLYDKIDNMQSDFDSVISYVDLYYEKEVSAREPLYVSKHQVPNRNCKGMKSFHILLL
jgi:chromosome segregation ATPase